MTTGLKDYSDVVSALLCHSDLDYIYVNKESVDGSTRSLICSLIDKTFNKTFNKTFYFTSTEPQNQIYFDLNLLFSFFFSF